MWYLFLKLKLKNITWNLIINKIFIFKEIYKFIKSLLKVIKDLLINLKTNFRNVLKFKFIVITNYFRKFKNTKIYLKNTYYFLIRYPIQNYQLN